jgi:hypothetical protein
LKENTRNTFMEGNSTMIATSASTTAVELLVQ